MGGKQLGFSDFEQTTLKMQTKREEFPYEMEAVVPWRALIALIEPLYPNARKNGGSPPFSFFHAGGAYPYLLVGALYQRADPASDVNGGGC